MNKSMHAGASLLCETGSAGGRWVLFFAVSIICHLIVFAVLIFAPIANRKISSPVINVDLIAFTTPASFSGSRPFTPKKHDNLKHKIVSKKKEKAYLGKTLPKPDEPGQAVAKIDPKPLERVSVSSKKKRMKKSLKRKSFNAPKVVKSAVTRIKKSHEESRPKVIADAIGRLKRQVKERGKKGGPSGEQAGSGRVGPGAAAPKVLPRIEQIYQNEIMYHIQKNWAFSEQLAGGRTDDLRVALGIKIMPNGEIREIWFDKRSGNSYFDESAYKAVKKSNPLPPLPEEFSMPFYNIGFIFNPLGLE